MNKEKIIVPYTNGIDEEIKGYFDLTEIIEDAVKEAEKELKEINKQIDQIEIKK